MKKEKEKMPALMTTTQLKVYLGDISHTKLEEFKKMPGFPKPESKFSTKNFHFYSTEKIKAWLQAQMD